jgi:hypothetical protein
MLTTVSTVRYGYSHIYNRFAGLDGGVHVTVIVNRGMSLLRRRILSPFIAPFGLWSC